jgi:hypothetical protein
VADSEPQEEISASTTQPLPWPDPTRPIINAQPGAPAPPGHPQQGGWSGYGSAAGLPGPGHDQIWPPPVPPAPRRPLWPTITLGVVVLMLVLIAVWLLWWR